MTTLFRTSILMPMPLSGIVSFVLLTIFTILIFVLVYLDQKQPKKKHKNPYVSFIIPCYNDGHVVRQCIESIYQTYDPARLQLIVVNDCSKDDSAEVIKAMQSDYDFIFIDLPKNIGKADALNHASKRASYDIIAFVDADAQINPTSFNDVLDRFETDPRMGAISCPYRPSNMGSFWSYMQDIEYVMLKIVQGSYNINSALAAWGGCLTVRKEAFEQLGGYALHAITEDMYLAMHMNKFGWRVQQSPYPIVSEVPDNFRVWLKQKIRWCSGAVQAFITHWRVWIRNPIHVLFTILIHTVSIIGTIALLVKLLIFGEFIELLMMFVDLLTFRQGWDFFIAVYGNEVLINIFYTSIFAVFSLPFVIGAIQNWKQVWKILLWFPYVLFYMSLYSLVGLYSVGRGIYKYATLKEGERSR